MPFELISPGRYARAVFVMCLCFVFGACSWMGVDESANPAESGLADTTQIGMKVLRARLLEEQLTSQWKIHIPPGPHAFGQEVEAELILPNPFGREFLLLEPAQGFILEFSWRVERWMPFASSEVVYRKHVANFDRLLEFSAGQTIRYPIELPLGGEGEQAAVWRIQLSAKLRCDGLEIDGEAFPVGSIIFKGSKMLALPGNWETLRATPLQNLEKLITISDPQVDRHLLVCAALLSKGQQATAVDLLVGNLDKAPSVRRMDTMMAALRFLTGRDFGENSLLWKEWWKERKIDSRE